MCMMMGFMMGLLLVCFCVVVGVCICYLIVVVVVSIMIVIMIVIIFVGYGIVVVYGIWYIFNLFNFYLNFVNNFGLYLVSDYFIMIFVFFGFNRVRLYFFYVFLLIVVINVFWVCCVLSGWIIVWYNWFKWWNWKFCNDVWLNLLIV